MTTDRLEMLKEAFEKTDLGILDTMAHVMVGAMMNRNKVMFIGCGGSAAQAQHFAAELAWRYKEEHTLPAIALTTDTSFITAISNDYTFSEVFRHQVEALGNRGDVLVCLSTSGTSTSIVNAAMAAQHMGIKTIGLSGPGGYLHTHCDHVLRVCASQTPTIQEVHLFAIHTLCERIEDALRSL